jgi:hypothetical protein
MQACWISLHIFFAVLDSYRKTRVDRFEGPSDFSRLLKKQLGTLPFDQVIKYRECSATTQCNNTVVMNNKCLEHLETARAPRSLRGQPRIPAPFHKRHRGSRLPFYKKGGGGGGGICFQAFSPKFESEIPFTHKRYRGFHL